MKSDFTLRSDVDFEGVAGIHNPSGGGVHEFQFFDAGSADRGERRLITASDS